MANKKEQEDRTTPRNFYGLEWHCVEITAQRWVLGNTMLIHKIHFMSGGKRRVVVSNSK